MITISFTEFQMSLLLRGISSYINDEKRKQHSPLNYNDGIGHAANVKKGKELRTQLRDEMGIMKAVREANDPTKICGNCGGKMHGAVIGSDHFFECENHDMKNCPIVDLGD